MHDQHSHDHGHTSGDFGTTFAIATALNLGLVAVQVFYGVVANSVALLADAGHNFDIRVPLGINSRGTAQCRNLASGYRRNCLGSSRAFL